MKPLKIAILWHFHQPYYKINNEYILPWTRLHGIKDYYDLPALFYEFPNVKQTINIVPSMWIQIEEYINGKCKDKIQRLSIISPNNLSPEEKKVILRLFFLCNEQNMLLPHPRYKELFELSKKNDAIDLFKQQDWLDLQAWYNLCWFGNFSAESPLIKRMIKKGSNFSSEEINLILESQIEILKLIKPTLLQLQKLGQIEISCSPFYHPILPLVYDNRAALESMPDAELPEIPFSRRQDSMAQIEKTIYFCETNFGMKPNGFWPSEGSISNDVLEQFCQKRLKWAASDELVLANSLKENYYYLDKFFPRNYKSKAGDISLFFRDHQLSDAIGFVYSQWNPQDAAYDFINRLNNIKSELINHYGEVSLNYAVIPVILDGENCWEFYKENGIHFRRKLYEMLSDSDNFKTVTYTEALENNSSNFLKEINNIKAASWINGDFKIWFGHEEHRKAWTMLSKVRNLVEDNREKLAPDILNEVMEEIYICEGSDWFWWYGDEHQAENKYDFDVMFRQHIRKIYELMNCQVPDDVNIPISKQLQKEILKKPSENITIKIDGKSESLEQWNKAGFFRASSSMSAMHQIGELLKLVYFCSDNENLYFRFMFLRELKSGDSIELILNNNKKIKLNFGDNFNLNFDFSFKNIRFNYAFYDCLDLQISKGSIGYEQEISFKIKTKTNEGEIIYPLQGEIGF